MLLSVFIPGLSAAEEHEQPPSPEIKKTVDAFAGSWTGTGDVVLPGKQPVGVTLAIDCTKTALGRAVVCTYRGKTAFGPTEATLLVGYDELGKAVHIMAATSDGEVHDHACRWKADTIACDLYKGAMGTLPITEELAITVESRKLVLRTAMFSGGKPLSSMTWTWNRR
jgi:hypothetical protein